jgi:hypothetical protein
VKAPEITPTQATGCDSVDNYDWNIATARAICLAESRGNPNAYNLDADGSNDEGLMQINSCHGYADRFNPIANMQEAYRIYQGSGWTAWSTYNNGKYEQYL